MTVTTYDSGERTRRAAELLSLRLAEPEGELILLPIPSTDGGLVRGTDIALGELVNCTGADSAVVGYALPADFVGALKCRGAFVFDLYNSEEFLTLNAALTAEAALGIILSSEPRAPRELKIGVVGYGRIGKRLVSLLMFLGASVRVYTTRESVALSLGEAGADAELITEGVDFSGLDLLVNTAPDSLFSSLARGGRTPRIIELASGDNFPKGLAVERYPALPSRVYPESAGKMVAEAVVGQLVAEGRI